MHIGIINEVSTINKIEIPSIPSLNFINPLIQSDSSMNWNPTKFLSNEYQRNRHKKKFATLVNKEIDITLWLFLDFDKKINKDPNRGKKIIEDSIGKFILVKY